MKNTQHIAKTFPQPGHDHDSCVADALLKAEEACTRRGTRFTALRREVLELVWNSHGPIGAYDILDRMERKGRPPAPITVYRALDFLMKQGLVHRLASLNAYVGCDTTGAPHDAQFLICDGCGVVAELNEPSIDRTINQGASRVGFTVNASVVEMHGLCPDCRDG